MSGYAVLDRDHVLIGVLIAHSLPEWKLKRSFGAFLVFVSLLMLVKTYLPPEDRSNKKARVFAGLLLFPQFMNPMMDDPALLE
jgi:uncharacterized membrane protein YfcA